METCLKTWHEFCQPPRWYFPADTLRKERDELKKQFATAQQQQASANQELQKENELILLQLHQVQEELEHYFLENQKLQTQIDEQAKRWSRVEARFPNYLDYESFEPIQVDLESDTPSITWKLANAIIRGEQVSELLFETTIQNGKPCISLNGVSLTPRALTDPKATQQIEDFKRIRNRDMTHMLAAASVLEDYFAHQTASQIAETDVDASFWRQPLLLLAKDLRSLPSIFRYDRVQLKRELIHTDYEHLWLVLQGASYGKYQWPKFEFRIGAANIRPGQFSTLPKLEIPLIDGKTKPFESWYEESYDDYGGKFELRFDINRKIFDVSALKMLNDYYKRMMIALITLVQDAMSDLKDNKVAISRKWIDWIIIAKEMQLLLIV